ncbi:hypothetical protein GUJ93_ZPchr0006g44163 [Zizania palustris]|uniref:RIN4 pathogenic type III effector avirulence factor Avr cleavage site domain-containing protein n=2 Tax=Zizania palustris TaxID=103762 RepID=A0A8J5VWR1_ZIZPA|nr:hypothetical protein GUJ93_ZPchr0006g44163 [Zizania palustris]
MAAKRASVPKFGSWDGDNVGYTVYFEKVRENKGATAPPLHRPSNPKDPEDNPGMSGGASPPSRPATSSGHREPQRGPTPDGQHRRTGSNSSATSSDPGIQSKFAPPPQYQPRPSPHNVYGQYDHHGHGHHHQPPAGQHGGRRAPAPRAHSASTSPESRQRPSAVPKFGAWDNGAAAQGFTVQFDNVKRHREMARGAATAGGAPVRRAPSPEAVVAAARRSRDPSIMSKMFGCFTVRD